MGQRTGPKLGNEYVKAVYCQSVHLAYMQCTFCETVDWMNHKVESGFLLMEKYEQPWISR